MLAASFSPDGRTVVTASGDKTARLWDAASGKELRRLTHEEAVTAASFSPDGRMVVTASDDKTVRLWDASKRRRTAATVASASGACGVVQPRRPRRRHRQRGRDRARLWDTQSGEELQRLTHEGRVWAASFSPDGRTVVTASEDRTARLWDAASGKELQRLTHEEAVTAASFSPDGRTVITASQDGTPVCGMSRILSIPDDMDPDRLRAWVLVRSTRTSWRKGRCAP